MNVGPNQSAPSTSSGASSQEFSIRVPKDTKKKYNIMRFNSSLNVDFTQWSQVKMERENNKTEKHPNEEMPKYGAGSEYRREEKEDARRKRLGYASRGYNPDDQPWILKCGGKNGKKFRGIREGGVGENAAYYVFTHGNDGSIEAYPAAEWYNFQPIQRFKALSAEEAEQEFGKRNRSLNYFAMMVRKKLHKGEDDEMEDEGPKKKNKGRDLKISDMDDWVDSDEEDDADSDEGDDEEKKESKKKNKKDVSKKKNEKKQRNTDDSAGEESDDGDEEGRELDYISDSSEDVSDHEAKIDKEMQGVSDESALRKLLTSDEEEEEEEEKKNNEEGNKSDQEKQNTNDEASKSSSSAKKKKKKKSLNSVKGGSGDGTKEETSSEFSADSSDSDIEKVKNETNNSDSQPSTFAESSSSSEPAPKKARLDLLNDSGISEEAVRRYLMRKPMTTTELLQKFKKPRTNLNSEQLVNVMTIILKKINPISKKLNNKMYLSLIPENPKSKS